MDQYLQVFKTVVEKESFSRAAEHLHMTQPAVSQHIKTLERNTGAKLLERSNKFVHLTKAGEIVYHHATEIIGLYATMQKLVDDLTNKASGSLLIGASYTFGEYILPKIIARIQETYPLIDPTITIGNSKDITDLVENHQLDVGIIEGNLMNKNLSIEEIAEDSMLLVASSKHHLASMSNTTIKLSDLAEEKWIVREMGSGTREAAETLFAQYEIAPAKMMEFGSTQIIKESVEAGLGITLLSGWAIQKEVLIGTLQVIDIDDFSSFTRKFSLITRSPYQTKALEVFTALVRRELLR